MDNIQENRKVRCTKDRSDTSHQNVDGESLPSMKMQTAEKLEDNPNQKKMEKSEGCRSSGTWKRKSTKRGPTSITHAVRWKKAPPAWGADPSTGQVKLDLMNYV